MHAGYSRDLSRSHLYIYQGKNPTLHARGVQIRSETDPIRSDFGTKYSFRIGLIKLFRSRIGSDFDIRNKLMN
jgi:hypothetical protein